MRRSAAAIAASALGALLLTSCQSRARFGAAGARALEDGAELRAWTVSSALHKHTALVLSASRLVSVCSARFVCLLVRRTDSDRFVVVVVVENTGSRRRRAGMEAPLNSDGPDLDLLLSLLSAAAAAACPSGRVSHHLSSFVLARAESGPRPVAPGALAQLASAA